MNDPNLSGEGDSTSSSSRFRLAFKILTVFVIFIVYAGYAHRSGVKFGGEPTFVDSPGFIKFSESSGISGLVNLTSGVWGSVLGIEAPPVQEVTIDVANNIDDEEIVAIEAEEVEIIEDVAVEAPGLEATEDKESSQVVIVTSDEESAKCADMPDVPWWKNKTQEESVSYVNSKYSDDWKLYISKWEAHLSKVIDVYVAGKKALIKDTGTILTGEELADYVNQIEERISIIYCYSRKASPTY